jgi:hypothetical protein
MSKGREGLARRRWASRAAVQYSPTSKQCEFGSRERSTEYVSPHLTCAKEAVEGGVSLRGNHFSLAFSEFRFVQLKIQPDK